MKITKVTEETTYSKIAKEMVFDVNGKKVRVNWWQVQDYEMNDYDGDCEANEADLKDLTDIEAEALGENLNDWIALKVGESEEVNLDDYEN